MADRAPRLQWPRTRHWLRVGQSGTARQPEPHWHWGFATRRCSASESRTRLNLCSARGKLRKHSHTGDWRRRRPRQETPTVANVVYSSLPFFLEQLCEEFERSHFAGLTTNTVKGHQTYIKQLKSFFGGRVLTDVTTQLVEQYRDHRRQQSSKRRPEQTIKGATVNRELECLQCIMRPCGSAQVCSREPCGRCEALQRTAREARETDADGRRGEEDTGIGAALSPCRHRSAGSDGLAHVLRRFLTSMGSGRL